MLGKIKAFHKKTMEEYQKNIEKEMQDWKKRVLRIHELVEVLFYPEEIDICSKSECLIRGDLVRGRIRQGDIMVLLDGRGEELARGKALTDLQEKEGSRRSLLQKKNYEIRMELLSLHEKKLEELDQSSYQYCLKSLMRTLSMLVNP